jgi:hypothetical protein
MEASEMKTLHRACACVLLAAWCHTGAARAAAAPCPLASPPQRVALLELYTSEGCNSCPPADRWVSALPAKGFGRARVVPLAFHVDYWNELGWVDRFSHPRYSARQRASADRRGANVIYTPQILLNGRDWRPRDRDAALPAELGALNGQPATTAIRASISREAGALRVRGELVVGNAADRPVAQAWVALFENGLASEVRNGENAGRRLEHDFVVRDLIGPLDVPATGTLALDVTLAARADSRPERTGAAVFVQRRDTGDILQAVAADAHCPA